MRYEPVEAPKSINASTSEIHDEIDNITSEGFDGIVALDGRVNAVIGNLSDNDLLVIEEHLESNLKEIDRPESV